MDMYANLNDKDGLMDEEGNKTQAVLATTYFEKALLDEDQKNIDWLLADFDPDNDAKDLLLLEGITGFKATPNDQEHKVHQNTIQDDSD